MSGDRDRGKMNTLSCRVVPQSNPECTACIIFLHGAANTADGLINLLKAAWGDDISFPYIRMVFPTAPSRPYTLLDGQISTVWFDQHTMCPKEQEVESTDDICSTLSDIINDEVKRGIPKNRIIIGGYSMGGSIGMTLGLKFHRDVAGVFALSSYLTHHSTVYKTLKELQLHNTEDLPPVFLYHGERDDIVPLEWAKDTYKTLTNLGVKGELHIANIEHELTKEEMQIWRDWVIKLLPERI